MKKVVVSKPGEVNPFGLTPQVVKMRGLVRALNRVAVAGSNECKAIHGLQAAVQRSSAIISNIRRSAEAQSANRTLQPFLVAIDLANIVHRRSGGLRVTNELIGDALQLVEKTAKECIDELSKAMKGDDSPSWPDVKITPELDKIVVSVSSKILSGLP